MASARQRLAPPKQRGMIERVNAVPGVMLGDCRRNKFLRVADRFFQRQTPGQTRSDSGGVSAAGSVGRDTTAKRRRERGHTCAGKEKVDSVVAAEMATFQ